MSKGNIKARIMTPSNDLFILVKSMSKAEKRYFKLYSSQNSRNGSNNYIRLFDAIDNQTNYDEGKLKKKFSGECFAKKLAGTKYLLYEQILKSLRNFHSGRAIDSKLNALIEEADVLFHKALYKQSQKLIQKAKRLAENANKTGYLHMISQFEKRLRSYLYTTKCNSSVDQLIEEDSLISDKIQTEATYLELAGKMRMLYEVCRTKCAECNLEAAVEIIKHPLLSERSRATTFISELLFLEIHSLNARLNGNALKASRYSEKITQLWNDNPDMIRTYQEEYTRTIADIALIGFNAGQLEVSPEIIEHLNSTSSYCEQERSKINLLRTILEFGYNLHTSNYPGCDLIEKELIKMQDLHLEKLAPMWKVILFYQLGVYCFITGRYNDSIDWMMKVSEFEKSGLVPSIIDFCKLLQIPVHYELENFGFLEYQLRAVQRYFRKRKKIGEKEALFFKYMKKSLNVAGDMRRKELFHQLQVRLNNSGRNNISKLPFADKVIDMWINKRVGSVERDIKPVELCA